MGPVLRRPSRGPGRPVEVLDTDLSSTLQADKLFRENGLTPAALHLEFEVSGRLGIPERLLRYNVAARGALGAIPVHSVIVLLRPEANATDLTGLLELEGAGGRAYLTFRYTSSGCGRSQPTPCTPAARAWPRWPC